MSLASELLAHIVLIGFASHVILSANPGSSLFSWHPTCMVLAWVLFNEGVLLFRKPSMGWRVAVHWALQASALTLALIGGFCIYKNKEDADKRHFTTIHSWFGILTQVLMVTQAVGGNLANYSVPLARKLPLFKPKVIKWGHRMAGSVALTSLSVTVFLALYSYWFQAVTSNFLWWTSAIVVLYPVLHALKTAYF